MLSSSDIHSPHCSSSQKCKVRHVPGTRNSGPDALSRHAQGEHAHDKDGAESQVLLASRKTISPIMYNDVRNESDKDESIIALRAIIKRGYTEVAETEEGVQISLTRNQPE